MNRILTFLAGMMFVSTLNAQGYTIEFNIKGEKNKDALLAMHYGTVKYSVDTATIDKKGKAVFTGDKPLAPGMYLIAIEGGQILDFLISDTVNQEFSISVKNGKYLESLSFTNSPENEAFADYSRFLFEKQKKETELNKKEQDKNNPEEIKQEIESLKQQMDAKVNEIRTNFAGSLLESVSIAMNPIQPEKSEVPESADSATRYLFEFYKNHYWDKLTLMDSRMLNTPILIPAIDNYFKNMILPIPDSIVTAIDFVLSKTVGDSIMLRSLTGHFFNHYMGLNIMGMETVVVHLIDNYYLTDKIHAEDETFIKSITDYADKRRATLIGKKGQDLKMETITGDAVSLYDIDAPYILVYFFEASCGHCKEETPKVYKVFQEFKDKGLAGFCVYTQTNKEEWMKYISEKQFTDWINVWDPRYENDFRTTYSVYTVPQVFVLNKDRTIVGRGLESQSLAQLLGHLFRNSGEQ